MMAKLRHWFWHIYALLTLTGLDGDSVSDAEWQRYRKFMLAKGYKDGSLVP